MSRHHTEVATEDEQLKEPLCRDIWKLSRHLGAIATSGSFRDINTESEVVATAACKEIKVATSTLEERRSRHQSDVATSVIWKEVATSFSARDTSCIEKKVTTTRSCHEINGEDMRSRHHQAVATTGTRKRGRDIIKLSRHPLQKLEGRDNI